MDPTHFTFDDFAFPTADLSPHFGVDGFQWLQIAPPVFIPVNRVVFTLAVTRRAVATLPVVRRRVFGD